MNELNLEKSGPILITGYLLDLGFNGITDFMIHRLMEKYQTHLKGSFANIINYEFINTDMGRFSEQLYEELKKLIEDKYIFTMQGKYFLAQKGQDYYLDSKNKMSKLYEELREYMVIRVMRDILNPIGWEGN